jgi:hypothetical protein
LIAALIAARSLERYTWEGTLDVGAALAANAGDCFPTLEFATVA